MNEPVADTTLTDVKAFRKEQTPSFKKIHYL